MASSESNSNREASINSKSKNDVSQEPLSIEIDLLLNNTDEPFIVVDLTLSIVLFNTRFKQLYQKYLGAEVKVGASILDYATQDRRSILKSLYQEVFAGNQIESEMSVPIPDEVTRKFTLRFKPAFDKHQSIVGAFVSIMDVTEKSNALEQLTLSAKRFRALVENGADAVVIIGANKQLTYASPSIERVIGYSEEEVLTLSLFELIHPEDLALVGNKLEEALGKPGIPISGHTSRVKHKNGSWRWLEATVTNMLDDPHINGIIDNFRDVTDSVIVSKVERLEHQLLQESIKLELSLEQILSGYLSGLESVFTGMKTSILLIENGHISHLAAPSVPEAYTDALNGEKIGSNIGPFGTAAFEKKRIIVSDIANDPRWETYKPIALRFGLHACWSQPIFNSENQVIATFTSYYSDPKLPTLKELDFLSRSAALVSIILENHRKSHVVKSSNERYNYLNKATDDAIYDWDVQQDLFNWGEGFYRVFGHPKTNNGFHLSHWTALMHPTDAKKNEKNWNKFLASKNQSRWNKEFRFRRGDGSYAYVEEIGHLIRDAAGKPQRMIGVLRDISKRRGEEIQKHLQQEVSAIFKDGISLSQILDRTLIHLCDFGEYPYGEVWLVSSDQHHLNLISTGVPKKAGRMFAKKSANVRRFAHGEGLPGKVWETKQPEVWDNLDTKKAFVRKDAAKAADLKSAFALPLFHNMEFIGVLVLISDINLSDLHHKTEPYESLGDFLGAEIKRRQQEEEMRLLFYSAPDILAVASPYGYFTKANPAFCHLLDYSESEITSQPFKNFIHPDDLVSTEKEYIETIDGSRQAQGFVNRYRAKSGEYRWISWNSSQAFGEDGFVFSFGRDITEIKELQDLLDTATRLARIGSWEIDLIKNSVYWSPVTRQIHEVSEDFEPNLETGIEFYHHDYQDEVRTLVNDCIQHGTSIDMEMPIITASGDERWIRCIAQADFSDGRCQKLYGSFQDINQRKVAELAVEEAYQEKNEILESIGDAFFAVDKNFTVTYWNRMAETLLQTPREKIIDQNLWDVFGDAVTLPSYENYHKAMNETTTVHFEDFYLSINKWFEISAYASGQGLTVYFKDITERKEAQVLIRESKERFEKVAEATNDAIWDWDIQANTHYTGKGFHTLFGYDVEDEVTDWNIWAQKIHPEDKTVVMDNLRQVIEGKSDDHFRAEYRYLKANGDYAYVTDRGVVMRDDSGKAVRMVGAMSDITHHHEYEESLQMLNTSLEARARELAISNAELEQFAYVASHDLQEPLRMVSGFLTQLEKKYGDALDDKAHQYIDFAVDGSKRMRQIILDLLEFSRVGKHDEQLKQVDLNDIVDEVCQLQRKRIEESNARIIFSDLPSVNSFRTPLLQLIHNLLSNALKYARKDTSPIVEIKAEEMRTSWQLSVSDNGIGIEREYFDKIFVIFQRLHRKEEFSGTGMGLAIVKKIAESLGGNVWVESEVGKGSTFYFTLPK